MNQSALAQWKIPPLAAAAAQPHYHNLFNSQASSSTAMKYRTLTQYKVDLHQ